MVESDRQQIVDAVKAGVIDGVHALAKDSDFLDTFWERGFQRMTSHAQAGASQWIGKRLLTAIFVSLLTVSITVLVKLGAFKL